MTEPRDIEKEYQKFIQSRSLAGGGCLHGYLRDPRTCLSCNRDWEEKIQFKEDTT